MNTEERLSRIENLLAAHSHDGSSSTKIVSVNDYCSYLMSLSNAAKYTRLKEQLTNPYADGTYAADRLFCSIGGYFRVYYDAYVVSGTASCKVIVYNAAGDMVDESEEVLTTSYETYVYETFCYPGYSFELQVITTILNQLVYTKNLKICYDITLTKGFAEY